MTAGPAAINEAGGSVAFALDVSRPTSMWTRRERAALAARLDGALETSEIARRLGVGVSTVREYLRDPDGSLARARGSSKTGVCGECGLSTGSPRGARQFRLCPRCAAAARAKWTRGEVLNAYLDWWRRFGVLPTSTDWNCTHAHRRGGRDLERFLSGCWPTSSVVRRLFDSWVNLASAARVASARVGATKR
jgi:hypothetical protein